jgi:hypothetical protein
MKVNIRINRACICRHILNASSICLLEKPIDSDPEPGRIFIYLAVESVAILHCTALHCTALHRCVGSEAPLSAPLSPNNRPHRADTRTAGKPAAGISHSAGGSSRGDCLGLQSPMYGQDILGPGKSIKGLLAPRLLLMA